MLDNKAEEVPEIVCMAQSVPNPLPSVVFFNTFECPAQTRDTPHLL